MFIDATLGINRYTITLRIDSFWFWKLWYSWENQGQNCYSTSLGLFEIEVRVPKKPCKNTKDGVY